MTTSSQSSPVVIIGAGLGGLAAACTLSARGHRVVVCEANDWTGGKACEWSEGGFRFDMGPTILTVPAVLERIFEECGTSIHERLDLRRLETQWRCFFEDRTVLDLNEDVETMAGCLDRLTAGDGQGYRDLLAQSAQLHELSERFFFYKSVGGVPGTLDFSKDLTLQTLRDFLTLRLHSTFGREIRRHIKDPRSAQMFDHLTQYVGSNPFQAPAVLAGIAHMQVRDGVWYPMGGTRAVPEALRALAEEQGVEFRTNTRIARILQQNRRVVGVLTETGETIAARAVVSNMDAVRTMRELVGDGADLSGFERRWGRRPPACSGVVMYLGLKKAYDHLAHHNFVFSRDPEEEFRAIYEKGQPAPDPTCYLAAPARTEPGVAPEGGEALYVLVHTPYLRRGQDWRTLYPGYRQVILDKLKSCGGMPDIEERITVEHHLTPRDIHDRYSPLRGAIYGLAAHGRINGAFKPANRVAELDGLYLAGGAAHPGAGMPMALMSGWIAADCADQDGPRTS